MSNQGCYNMFLAVALIIGLCHPDHDVSAQLHPVRSVLRRRQPSLWGAATVKKSSCSSRPCLSRSGADHVPHPGLIALF
ncbi:DUF1304 domain-containing protein [Massilia sp. H-1]|nr:DUF1304 domain-containing protein [Massilia sp. H-1]